MFRRNTIVDMRKCPTRVFESIGKKFHVSGELWCWENSDLIHFPGSVKVSRDAIFFRCKNLTTLADEMFIGDGFYISGCTSLVGLPKRVIAMSDILARGCVSLTNTGDHLRVGGCMDLRGCKSFGHISDDTVVLEYIDLRECDHPDVQKSIEVSKREPLS